MPEDQGHEEGEDGQDVGEGAGEGCRRVLQSDEEEVLRQGSSATQIQRRHHKSDFAAQASDEKFSFYHFPQNFFLLFHFPLVV